jgi:YD repeat-containing protein
LDWCSTSTTSRVARSGGRDGHLLNSCRLSSGRSQLGGRRKRDGWFNYVYDALHRLYSVDKLNTPQSPDDTYFYDGIGRFYFRREGGGDYFPYTYDPSHPHAPSAITAAGYIDPFTFTYDANGNQLTRNMEGTTVTFTYDEANRLVSKTEGGATTRSATGVNPTDKRYTGPQQDGSLYFMQDALDAIFRYSRGLPRTIAGPPTPRVALR